MEYGFKEYKPSEIISGHVKVGEKNRFGREFDANSLYFTKDGKPWIGVMGEYHFSRDNRENWKRELLKMKAGGVTIVSTYLFWIYHEEIEGEWNFEGDNDLRAFLKDAADAGLYVFLRIGPWAHGECRNGGFPDWLVNKGIKLRQDNPEYLTYVYKWFKKIYENCSEFFFKDGGPIIGVQIENELTDDAFHILTLKKMAEEIGFKAPYFTATGWNAKFGAHLPLEEVLPIFGAYADAPWSDKISELPLSPHYAFYTDRNDAGIGVDLMKETPEDGWRIPYDKYPFCTCEIGPGMQSTHHRRVVMTGMDAYAMSLVKLGAGNNLIGYYMYHGGVNKLGKLSTLNEDKKTGYPNDYASLSYDFGTCISQYGEIREQYRLLNELHLFVNDFGDILAPMESVGASEFVKETDTSGLRYCMRTDGKSGFIFVNNYQRHAHLQAHKDVVFKALDVEFMPVNVGEDTAFILPFNLNLYGDVLKASNCQLLCKDEDTYYFKQIPGNAPAFEFTDGSVYTGKTVIRRDGYSIVVIPEAEARFIRKLNGDVVIGNEEDLCLEDGRFTPVVSENAGFSMEEVKPANISLYDYELSIGGKRKLTWMKISVSGPEGFVTIKRDDYDVAQIYADGKLAADNFNEFINWRVPAKLLYNHECYLVMSELKDDFYVNKEDVEKVSKER